PIDPVRYISNRSSGKMGFALAVAAQALGARTHLISGPTSLTPPHGVAYTSVETTAEMHEAVNRLFARANCLIMAAAPADFSPTRQADQKIKKDGQRMELSFEPTVDILKEMGRKKKKGQVLVGFALETEDGVVNARHKLKEKNLDLIVLNNPRDKNSAFDHDTNKVSLIRPGRKPDHWDLQQKSDVATNLLESIAAML
ncbi:MAG: phosphopantothenoylcysteine decarboxylase, partial [bacterium]|nr:phosphopantothenoylcysteine decarboxylase [bacterium]